MHNLSVKKLNNAKQIKTNDFVYLGNILENWSFTTLYEKEMMTFVSHYGVIFRTNTSSCCLEQEKMQKTVNLSAFWAWKGQTALSQN